MTDSDHLLDQAASLSASLDQLQADVDYGRVRYAHVTEIQHYLNRAQEEIDMNRELVKGLNEIFKPKSE